MTSESSLSNARIEAAQDFKLLVVRQSFDP